MQRPRTPSRISESLHQRLNSYALAASAAGVSLMASAQPDVTIIPSGLTVAAGMVALSESVEAKIVYTPANRPLYCSHGTTGGFCHGTLGLDLNHDKVLDFKVRAGYGRPGSWLQLLPQNENEAWTTIVTNNGSSWGSYASALHKGKAIQRNAKFHQGRVFGMFYYYSAGASLKLGPWVNVHNRYLGLKFYIKGKPHYGWARLSTGPHTFRTPWATLTGYAYETIPNKPIIAGKTHGPNVITVWGASLGHLARGASALSAWRKAGGGR